MQPLKAIPLEDTEIETGWERDDLSGIHYRLPLTPYRGADFSRKCFIFPGQSAAQPGMGREDLQRFEVLQKRFAFADSLAAARGIPAPSLYIRTPDRVAPEYIPLIQCLSLFTMSVGLFELLLVNNERPALFTSHSFGEYAAFVASGISSFEDMFDIVYMRDKLSPSPSTAGAMIAVSAGADIVKQILRDTPAIIANRNSPYQTVVSVTPDHVKVTLAALKREGLAAKHLDSIPQPYHSPMLAETAEKLAEYVRSKRITFRAPRVPMLSSVSGKMITPENFAPSEIVNLIAKQLTAPLDFIGQIRTAASNEVRNFVELAHHKTCTPWVKDILQGESFKISVPPVLAPPPIVAPKGGARSFDSKLIGFLNKVVSSVTGYSIEEISLSNNFQEDLGIDSIKKAQIVFNFLEGQGDFSIDVQDNNVMNKIRTIEDVLAWYTKDKDGDAAAAGAAKFMRHGAEWIAQPQTNIDHLFERAPHKAAWLSLSAVPRNFADILAQSPSDVIFYDDGGAVAFEDILAAVQENYLKIKGLNLAFVSSDASKPEARGLDGFFKSLARELQSTFRSILFDEFDKARDAALVEKELGLPFTRAVRFAKDIRYVFAAPVRPAPAKAAAPVITVAAIGGARGITRAILKTLTVHGTKNIYILGRRAAADAEENLKPLRATGAAIHYMAGDAADRDVLEKFLTHATETSGTIDLLLHGGGNEYSGFVHKQTPDHVRRQLDVKLDGTRHLIELTRNLPIEKVICFASMAGEWGSLGQSVYAYANATMSYMCEQAAREGLPFQSIAWPAWDRVGMTENMDVYRQLALSGLRFLDPTVGCQLFMEMLADSATRSAVFDEADAKYYDELTVPALRDVFPESVELKPSMHLNHWTLDAMPDLQHHVILENIVAPISLSLATFLHLGFFRTGKTCRLVNITTSSFIPMHKKDSPYFLNFHQTDEEIKAEVRSNESHIEAQIMPLQDYEHPRGHFAMPKNVEFVEDKQKDYDDCKLAFQVTKNTYKAAGGFSCADLDLSAIKLRMGAQPVHVLACIIEAMLQEGGAGPRYLDSRSSIPFAMQSLIMNDDVRITDTYKVVAYFTRTSEDLGRNELYAYNADNELFIHIIGEQVRMWMPQ
ncbi:MAG TPA: SDR family NAD(P)-dependent oxidoreductase [Alphaproteobacteria bacterium]|nr:SDR family NAD(P)-dependent oxidoreductase [Alphaproteobacteria bacterium]